jgi:hypothetical protein
VHRTRLDYNDPPLSLVRDFRILHQLESEHAHEERQSFVVVAHDEGYETECALCVHGSWASALTGNLDIIHSQLNFQTANEPGNPQCTPTFFMHLSRIAGT